MSKNPDLHPARDVSSDIDDEGPPAGETTAAALASYIAEMAAELAILAERADFEMLGYFLRLARVEAEDKARALTAPAPTVEGSGRA
ncbi:hypothetical protein [Methylosinus sp. Sm6]|uniref:hypothetical protein n=1 Tax=Methylosinus sp. Sm6 TaxID=2866948 RepID=UPI001C99C12D|nr:hypothetical protein [Methylosinus sp. Sm6]MBY6243480.1 hypothetical protein [Methylosinus sp. Sm6]